MRWVVSNPARALVLVMAFSALVRCRADSNEAANPASQDAATEPPTDAPPDEQQPDGPDPLAGCNTLGAEWSAYVASHRSCSSASDCSVVGGAGGPASWCTNCYPSIGDPSGDAIAKSALSEAEPYLTKFQACVDAGLFKGCTWDAAPAKNLRCEGGACKADPGGCHVGDAKANDAPDADLDASALDEAG